MQRTQQDIDRERRRAVTASILTFLKDKYDALAVYEEYRPVVTNPGGGGNIVIRFPATPEAPATRISIDVYSET